MNQYSKELSIIQLLNSFFILFISKLPAKSTSLSSFFALKVVEWVKSLEGGIL